MILYLDTSALVKLLVKEHCSDLVEMAARNAEALVTSRIAYVETVSALARKHRKWALTGREMSAVLKKLDGMWTDLGAVELNDATSRRLILKHPLHTCGAIHLAAALEVRQSAVHSSVPTHFSSFDRKQVKAAVDEGFSVVTDPKLLP